MWSIVSLKTENDTQEFSCTKTHILKLDKLKHYLGNHNMPIKIILWYIKWSGLVMLSCLAKLMWCMFYSLTKSSGQLRRKVCIWFNKGMPVVDWTNTLILIIIYVGPSFKFIIFICSVSHLTANTWWVGTKIITNY